MHLDEGDRCSGVACAHGIASGSPRRDEADDHDRSLRGEQEGDLTGPTDILVAIFGRESEVAADPRSQFVPVKHYRGPARQGETSSERCGRCRLPGSRETGEPDRESALRRIRHLTMMPLAVSRPHGAVGSGSQHVRTRCAYARASQPIGPDEAPGPLRERQPTAREISRGPTGSYSIQPFVTEDGGSAGCRARGPDAPRTWVTARRPPDTLGGIGWS